ncbi:MAG: flagellar basal-body MS-ring/collar protein FliF [Actinomycetota bacterium]
MAGPDFQAIGRNIIESIQRMTGPQRLTLGLAFFATVMSIFFVASATGGTAMGTLYADLEPETAAAVTTELDSRGISYELMGGGRIINVPADQVHQLRLDMAAMNLPAGSDGWSLLDDMAITATTGDRTIAYQRAMQGELAKTISVIDGVSSATVHLVIPERDILVDDGKQASASVLLVTGSANLSPTQVTAIVNLVASSVEGLSTDQVSVTNDAGQVLAAPGDSSGSLGIESDIQFRASRQFETNLENRLEELLTRIVGIGAAQVTVSAELDYDTTMVTSETHTPIQSEDGTQLLTRDTTRLEEYRGEDVVADEEGELEIELPDETLEGEEAGFDEAVRYGLDEKDRIYIVDRVVTNAESAPGAIRSLSVAVVLDEAVVDAGRLPEIEQTISAAAGVRADRGDALAVSLLPVDEAVKAALVAQSESAELAGSTGGGLDLVGLLRTVGTVVIAVVALIFGVKYISRGPRRELIETINLDALEAGGGAGGDEARAAAELEAGEAAAAEAAALAEAQAEAEAKRVEEAAELAEIAAGAEEQLQSLIANQTDEVAGVLKQWLNEAEPVS